jgi:hypothetical protein
MPRYYLRVHPQRPSRDGPGQGKRDRVAPRERRCRPGGCRRGSGRSGPRGRNAGAALRLIRGRRASRESKPNPFRGGQFGDRRSRRGGETGGQPRGERHSCRFPRGGGQRVAREGGGDDHAGESVAGDAAGAGRGDGVRHGGQGLGGDGDREVAGAGDLDPCDPVFLFPGERGGQGRSRLTGVRAEGEGDAGGVLARSARRAQAGIGGRPEPGGGGRAGEGVPKVPGDHLPTLRSLPRTGRSDGRGAGQLADHPDHLAGIEGLGQVGVGTHVRTARDVILLGARRDQHDLDVRRVR